MRVEETRAALGINTRAIARFRQSSSDHPKRNSKLSRGHTKQPFNAHQSQYVGSRFFGYNSPAAAAREVFKPSTDSASLVVPSQKNIFQFWVLGSLGGSSQVGVFSHFYGKMRLYPALDAHRMGPHFGPNIFMKLGYLTSL